MFPPDTKCICSSLSAGSQIGKYVVYLGHFNMAGITVLISSSSCCPSLVTFLYDKSLHLQKMPLDFVGCACNLGIWTTLISLVKIKGQKRYLCISCPSNAANLLCSKVGEKPLPVNAPTAFCLLHFCVLNKDQTNAGVFKLHFS